jgi:hypothetical protein
MLAASCGRMARMGIYDEIQKFIATHKSCGRVSGSVDVPTEDGYIVNVRCICGQVFRRLVTVEVARDDLIFSTLLCNPN